MKIKKTIAILLAAVILSSLPVMVYAESTATSSTASSASRTATGRTASATSSAATSGPGRMALLEQRRAQLAEKAEELESRIAKAIDKAGEYAEMRLACLEKRKIMLDNQSANLEARMETLRLCKAIAKAVKALESNGQTLPADTLAAIADYKAQITVLKDELKSTLGEIKELMEANRENIKNKDFAAMQAVFEQVKTLQEWRGEQILAINALLGKMLALLPVVATSSTAASSTSSAS